MRPTALTRYRTVKATALVTGRPHRTIRTWAATGRIPSIKQGDRLLVDLVAAAKMSAQAGRRNRQAAA